MYLNAKTIKKISNNDLENLVRKFYNDAFIFDQNACSSTFSFLVRIK